MLQNKLPQTHHSQHSLKQTLRYTTMTIYKHKVRTINRLKVNEHAESAFLMLMSESDGANKGTSQDAAYVSQSSLRRVDCLLCERLDLRSLSYWTTPKLHSLHLSWWKNLLKQTAAVLLAQRTCPSDIWLLFLPVSQGVFIDHSLITLSSPLFAHLGFFQLLWLESNCFDWKFWRKLRDWQSQPSRKHHLLSFSLQNPHRWKSHVFSKFQHLRQTVFGEEEGKDVLCWGMESRDNRR